MGTWEIELGHDSEHRGHAYAHAYAYAHAMQVSDVVLEAVEGDARNVLCEAVEKHHATMLVVGSHGYGAIKRYLLHGINYYFS